MKVVLLSLFGFLINLGCVLGSDIYSSINWVPQNPLFGADGKNCVSGHRTLKVQLQSKVHFICPNTASVLQKTVVGLQTANMYENLWIVYNEAAFNKCDTTLKGQNKTSKLLLHCNTPTKLNYFPVIFAQFTAEKDGLTFQGGRKYYFIGTSDGTESHINDTHGGHCNDTQNKIFMKIEVYVCKKSNQTYTDELCEEGVGVLECPKPDPPTMASTTAPTMASTTAPTICTTPTTLNLTQTTTSSSIESVPSTKEEISTKPGTTNETSSTTTVKSCLEGPNSPQARTGVDKVQKELEMWRAVAIVLACILICIAAVVIIYHIRRKKDKCYDFPWIKRIRRQSMDPKSSMKSPADRQVSVGGVSNHAFTNSIIIRDGGEDEKRKSGSPSHLFYDVANVDDAFVNENPAIKSKGIGSGNSTLDISEKELWNGRSQDGNIVFQNNTKDVFYDKGEKSKGNSPA